MIEEKLSKEQFTVEFNKLYIMIKPVVSFGDGDIGNSPKLRIEYL